MPISPTSQPGVALTIGELPLLSSSQIDPAIDRLVVWDDSEDGAQRTKAAHIVEVIRAVIDDNGGGDTQSLAELIAIVVELVATVNQQSVLLSEMSNKITALAATNAELIAEIQELLTWPDFTLLDRRL